MVQGETNVLSCNRRGNYLPITARPSESGGEEEGRGEDDEIDEEDERKAGKETVCV